MREKKTRRETHGKTARSAASSSHKENTGETTYLVLIVVALAAIVFAVYARTFSFDFVNFDDPYYVYENPVVSAGLTVHGFVQAFTHGSLANWDPLTTLSHMVDCQMYGLRAGGHHLTNVLLHAASVVLLFLVLRLMTGALWRSALVAAVFAVHPLHVESVAWVTERKDVLSGLFFMLTLGAYWRYTLKPGPGRYLLVLLALALGLMSKSMLVTMPAILLLLDWWPLKRCEAGWKKLILEKAPMLALSLGATAVAFVTQAQAQAVQTLERVPLGLRLENAVVSCGTYLWQTIWPSDLAVHYPFPMHGLPMSEVLGAAAALVLITAVVVMVRKQQPYLLAGWLWFGVMLVPVIGLVQLGDQAHADRYMYLPQIGLVIGLTWWLGGLGNKWGEIRWLRWCAAVVVIFPLAAAACNQSLYWRDSAALWNRTLAISKNDATAHYNYGTWLAHKSNLDAAEKEFRQAVQFRSDYAAALDNLGYVLFQKGKADEAISLLFQAIAIDPKLSTARNNLGGVLVLKGRNEEAQKQFEEALKLKPDYGDAHFNLANLLAQKGQTAEAIKHYQAAISINPGDYGARNNLGFWLLKSGRAKEAASYLLAALTLHPDKEEARNNVNQAAWNMATAPENDQRDGTQALALARKLNDLDKGENPAYLATLAAAEAETGQFDLASATVSQAQVITLREGDRAIASILGEQLRQYQSRHPYRDTNVPAATLPASQ